MLSDGTIVYFISTENMKSFREKYEKRHQELIESRWTTAQNLSVRGFAVGLASLAYHFASKINNPTLNILGKALSVVGGLVSFFYPDVRDKLLGREFSGSYLDKDNQLIFWGQRYEGGDCVYDKVDGVDIIVDNLRSIKHNEQLKYTDKGYMLILRPKTGMCPFLSGIYEQDLELYNALVNSIDSSSKGDN